MILTEIEIKDCITNVKRQWNYDVTREDVIQGQKKLETYTTGIIECFKRRHILSGNFDCIDTKEDAILNCLYFPYAVHLKWLKIDPEYTQLMEKFLK